MVWSERAFQHTSPGLWTPVDQELLLRLRSWLPKNRILRAQLKGRRMLSNHERTTLGEIGHRPGRKTLGELATAALPDTILGATSFKTGIASAGCVRA